MMTSYQGISSQSPHSSSGHQDSTEGTPDTSLTAFSPEEVRSSRPSNASSSGGAAAGIGQHDPFVTTPTEQPLRVLSATATTFQPQGRGTAYSSATHSASVPAKMANTSQPTPRGSSYVSPVSPSVQSDLSQSGTFSTDTRASRCLKISSIYNAEVTPLVQASLTKLQDDGFKTTGSSDFFHKAGVVYLRLSNINEAAEIYNAIKMENPGLAVEYISIVKLAQAVSASPAKHSAHEGQVVLTATYPAYAAVNKKEFEEGLRKILEAHGQLWAWQKISATEAGTFRLIAEFCDIHKAKSAVKKCNGMSHESGVMLSVQAHQPDLASQRLTLPQATPTRRPGEQSSLGEALGRLSLQNDRSHHFNTGPDALTSPVQIPSTSLPYMSSDQSAPFVLPAPPMGSFYARHPVPPFQQALSQGLYSHPPYAASNHMNTFNMSPYSHGSFEHGPYGRTNLQQSPFGSEHGYYGQGRSPSRLSPPYDRTIGRRQNAVKLPHHQRGRAQNPASTHHNHVDINRIQQGIDVRTTVMLRNIPNKLDQAQLKAIVDESSFGKYDFMYLRIDFSNNCNVGYAFINFNDPLDIIDFVRARSGEKWFKSDKVAEVSYATIQGKDCLVQKFRNSSVMLEPPNHRPKLYRTFNDHFGRVGEEERFPESDNASKLKRSCENAEHVGLFAPNAGQHVRDEQRRRRSQYDRGTSLAEREEYGYEEGVEDYSAYSPYGYPPY